MKNKIATLCFMILCLPMSVSAKNVDPSMIVPNNYERLENTVIQGNEDRSTLKEIIPLTPSGFDLSYETEDGKMALNAEHVPVTLPEKDTISAYHVSSGEVSQELADRLYDYFFPNGAYGYDGSDVTKDMYAEMIQEMEETLELIKNSTYEIEGMKGEKIARLEQMIEEYKGYMEDAPEEATMRLEPAGSTYVDQIAFTSEGTEIVQTLYVMSEDENQCLSIHSEDKDSIGWPAVRYNRWNGYNYSGVWGTPVEQCTEEEVQAIGVSQETATEIVMDFAEKIGVEWEMKDVLCVKGQRSVGEWDEMEDADDYTAFKFVMSPCTDGITNAVTSSYRIRDKVDDSYRIWGYEMINVIVEPDGIVWFEWDFPSTIEDMISENVGIISFDDAADIFKHIMPMIMDDEMERWNKVCAEEIADVSEVKLELIRVRKSDEERTGLLIPTWVFYGDFSRHFVYEEHEGEDHWDIEQQPWILMAVNAVDGSVIDIVEGY